MIAPLISGVAGLSIHVGLRRPAAKAETLKIDF